MSENVTARDESFYRARLEVRSAAVLVCIAISQVAWIGTLAYFAHRLLF